VHPRVRVRVRVRASVRVHVHVRSVVHPRVRVRVRVRASVRVHVHVRSVVSPRVRVRVRVSPRARVRVRVSPRVRVRVRPRVRAWEPLFPFSFYFFCLLQVPVGRVLVLDVKEVVANPSRRVAGSLPPDQRSIQPSLLPHPPSTDLVGSLLSVTHTAAAEKDKVEGSRQGGRGQGREQQLNLILREVESLAALKQRIHRASSRPQKSARRQAARQLSSLVETQVEYVRVETQVQCLCLR